MRSPVAAAAVLYAACALTGLWLTRHGTRLHLGSACPLSGHYRLHLSGWRVPAVLVAAAVGRWGFTLAQRRSWPRLLLAGYATALAWAVALALVAGPSAIARPLTTPYEYLHDVARIRGMGLATFLRTFTRYVVGGPDVPAWTTQVAGHPPGATLVFVALSRAGLGGAGWAAALVIAVGAAAVPAVLGTVRIAGGEEVARRAAPFVATAPLALWIATSADALFAGVAAASLYALARGAVRTGGLGLGVCLLLSYGLVLLAPPALAALAAGRRPITARDMARDVAWAAGGVLAVLAVAAVAGFWWYHGLAVTRVRIYAGCGWRDR